MRSRRLRWLVLVAGALLVAEGTSSVALSVLEQRRGLRYQTFERVIDPWRDQIRALLADDVTTAQAWPTRLEQLQPELEVLNYGVGGYGLDQTLLRFAAEGAHFAPHVVLIGVIADDVLRGVDDYSAFLADPVPALRGIVPHDHYAPPASEAGPLDASASVRLVKLLRAVLARPDGGRRVVRHGVFDLETEPPRLALATLRAAVEQIRRQGAAPLIVFFPDITELDARRDGRAITYRPLLERLAAEGVPVVDVLEGFSRRAPRWTTRKILRRSHYSPWANRLVAEILRDDLVARGLLPRAPG